MSPLLQLSLGQDGSHILPSDPALLDDVLQGYTSVTFRALERISDADSRVYLGKLDRASDESIDVVCKIVLNEDSDRLEDEAKLYMTKMKHLQGTTVPKFYGLFSGTYVNMLGKDRAIRCILIEAWGTSMATVKPIPMELRITIAEAALRIHAAGVQHNDLRLPNILVSADRSEVRITDFDNACTHRCGRAMPVILYSWEPTLADFNCKELHRLMCYFGLWTPATIFYLGRLHSVHNSSTAEKMLENAKPDIPDKAEEHLLAEADAVLKKYAKRYGTRFPFIGPPGDPISEGTDVASSATAEPKIIGLDRLEKCRKPTETCRT